MMQIGDKFILNEKTELEPPSKNVFVLTLFYVYSRLGLRRRYVTLVDTRTGLPWGQAIRTQSTHITQQQWNEITGVSDFTAIPTPRLFRVQPPLKYKILI